MSSTDPTSFSSLPDDVRSAYDESTSTFKVTNASLAALQSYLSPTSHEVATQDRPPPNHSLNPLPKIKNVHHTEPISPSNRTFWQDFCLNESNPPLDPEVSIQFDWQAFEGLIFREKYLNLFKGKSVSVNLESMNGHFKSMTNMKNRMGMIIGLLSPSETTIHCTQHRHSLTGMARATPLTGKTIVHLRLEDFTYWNEDSILSTIAPLTILYSKPPGCSLPDGLKSGKSWVPPEMMVKFQVSDAKNGSEVAKRFGDELAKCAHRGLVKRFETEVDKDVAEGRARLDAWANDESIFVGTTVPELPPDGSQE